MEYVRILIPYVVIIVVVLIIRVFFITPVHVVGSSMENTLHDGEVVLLDKITYQFKKIRRFDIVVIKTDDEPIIKRVIGLPGEEVYIEDGDVYINDKKLKQNFDYNKGSDSFILEDVGYVVIPDDMYFVLGDNRDNSADSRVIGLIPETKIMGKTKLIIWPLKDFGVK